MYDNTNFALFGVFCAGDADFDPVAGRPGENLV